MTENQKCNCGKEATHQFNPEDGTEIVYLCDTCYQEFIKCQECKTNNCLTSEGKIRMRPKVDGYQQSQIRKKINCQVFNQVKEVWPLTKKYDLIIIDGPACTSQATKEIAEKADLIIQPTGVSRLDLIPAVKEFKNL